MILVKIWHCKILVDKSDCYFIYYPDGFVVNRSTYWLRNGRYHWCHGLKSKGLLSRMIVWCVMYSLHSSICPIVFTFTGCGWRALVVAHRHSCFVIAGGPNRLFSLFCALNGNARGNSFTVIESDARLTWGYYFFSFHPVEQSVLWFTFWATLFNDWMFKSVCTHHSLKWCKIYVVLITKRPSIAVQADR